MTVAENAGTLLGESVPAIDQTTRLVQEIAMASQEQTTAIHEINAVMGQLDEVVHQNMAASTPVASMTASLATQATALKRLVGSFNPPKCGWLGPPSNVNTSSAPTPDWLRSAWCRGQAPLASGACQEASS